jgi:hypothetical protein
VSRHLDDGENRGEEWRACLTADRIKTTLIRMTYGRRGFLFFRFGRFGDPNPSDTDDPEHRGVKPIHE